MTNDDYLPLDAEPIIKKITEIIRHAEAVGYNVFITYGTKAPDGDYILIFPKESTCLKTTKTGSTTKWVT